LLGPLGHWRLFTVLLAVAAVWLLRAWILHAVAWGLIVDENRTGADYLWIAGGDHCYDQAAQLYHDQPSRRIVLVEQYPRRIVRAGVQLSPEAIGRRELARRGVPPEAVIVIPGRAKNAWEATRILGEWRPSRAGAEVLLLCDRFDSRRRRRIQDSALDADSAKHIHVLALPDRRFDESDWWRTRDGVKHCGLSWLWLTYAWCRGAPDEPVENWNPDDYEQTLRQMLKEAAR
jgi:hypothetical protein